MQNTFSIKSVKNTGKGIQTPTLIKNNKEQKKIIAKTLKKQIDDFSKILKKVGKKY